MAGYQIIGSAETTELQGGNKIAKVLEVQILTTPSHVFFAIRTGIPAPGTPPLEYLPTFFILRLAQTTEDLLEEANIAGILYSQDIDATGQLVDVWTVYWEGANGAVSGNIDFLYKDYTTPNVTAVVNAAVSAAEALLSG